MTRFDKIAGALLYIIIVADSNTENKVCQIFMDGTDTIDIDKLTVETVKKAKTHGGEKNGFGRTTIKFVFGVRWRYAKKNNCKISRIPRVDFCKTFIFLRTIFLSFELK